MSNRRLVVQVLADLSIAEGGPAGAARVGIATVLNWLKYKQGVAVPDSAYDGVPFEIDASEGQPCSVERLDAFWCVQFDRISPDTPGRIWRTEVLVGHNQRDALVGVRLAVIDAVEMADFEVSIPKVVRDLMEAPGLLDDGRRLKAVHEHIHSDEQIAALAALIESPARKMPVAVFSTHEGVNSNAEASLLARSTTGLVHAFTLSKRGGWGLTESLGQEFAVWGGAVRVYNPGFNKDRDEASDHPLYFREMIQSRHEKSFDFVNALRADFILRSVRHPGNEEAIPSFRSIKQAVLQKRLASLSKVASVKNEREGLLELELALLKQTIDEKSQEAALAENEMALAVTERDQVRAQLHSLRGKIEWLEQRGGEQAVAVEYPATLNDLAAWALNNFPGRLHVLTRAVRAARKSPYEDPQLVYKCLERLARGYVDARRSGAPVEDLFNDLGVHLERSGDPAWLSQWKEEYFVPHRGRNVCLNWHLKRGADKNERTTLRIYFFYDEDDQQVVVGHLPGHLTNAMT